jgi:hypothetical protein
MSGAMGGMPGMSGAMGGMPGMSGAMGGMPGMGGGYDDGGMMGGMGGGMMGGMGGGMMGGMGGPMMGGMPGMGGPLGENYAAVDFFSPYAYTYDDAPDIVITAGAAIAYSDPYSSVMILADGGNSITLNTSSFITNGSLTGGTGADNVIMSGMGAIGTIDLMAGTDSLKLADGGGSSITISNVEFLQGGTGSDAVNFIGTGTTVIKGSSGVDSYTLPGTAGAAYTFKYESTAEIGDTINGFASGTDNFLFSRSSFLGDGNSDGAVDYFQSGNVTSVVTMVNSTTTYWVRNTTTNDLYYDADADGVGTGTLVANLDASVAFGDIDFIA